jgi:uncharacterized SAM-binding protein YcdF (DUF218 family)
MFFVLSKILDFLITPLSWILLFALCGMLVRNRQLRRKLLWFSLSLLLFFTNPFIADLVTHQWEIAPKPSSTLRRQYEVGIVMGGSMRYFDSGSNRVVYSSSVDRMLQALQLYHDGHIKKILLTGGSGFVNFQEWKESGLIADVLLKSGVKSQDIILENNSRNTYENAAYSAKILKERNYGSSYLLITSATHMRRSMACFEKAGIHTEPFSADPRSGSGIYTPDKIIQPDAEYLVNWDQLLHEWVGMIMYKLAGYI